MSGVKNMDLGGGCQTESQAGHFQVIGYEQVDFILGVLYKCRINV
jgi:hypothetical protein